MSGWKPGQYSVRIGGAPAAPPRVASVTPADPAEAARWQALGDQLRLSGDIPGADRAYARQMRATVAAPDLIRAADAICDNRLAEADQDLRAILAGRPADPLALWMLAEVASRTGRNAEAEALLARCLQAAPGFTAARYAYAMVLYWRHRAVEALAQARRLLEAEPRNPIFLHLKATTLLQLGDDAAALEAYAQVLDAHPDEPLTWMSYGHALKTVGRQAEAVDAYRRSLDLAPALGEAWWSLANLKTVRFDAADIARMQAALEAPGLSEANRLQLAFRPRQGAEDAGQYEAAFADYAAGNARRRRRAPYDANETTAQMRRTRAILGRSFLAARAGQGSPRPDPIFIVGLPRSGSTLVEQILASHSQVEGTTELPTSWRWPDAWPARRGARARAPIRTSSRPWRLPNCPPWARSTWPLAQRPPQDRPALLHRQAAEQLPARRPHPPDPAEREDHRRAAPPAGLLLLGLQAALRAAARPSPTTSRISAATTATTWS